MQSSCSSTGRPAPELRLSQRHYHRHPSASPGTSSVTESRRKVDEMAQPNDKCIICFFGNFGCRRWPGMPLWLRTRLRSILLHYYFLGILSCTSYLCRSRGSSFSAYPLYFLAGYCNTPLRLLWTFLQATTL